MIALIGLALFAAPQDLSPEESLKRMKPAEGFQVSLVASEPEIRQPVTMTFDDRGRIWVIQYLQYPNPAGLKPVAVDQYLRTRYDRKPEPPPRGPRGADRVTILEDADGDGRYEKAKDFVSGLNLASGLCLGHGGVWVAQPPYLLFYPDRNGDDLPDGDPEVCLDGFGMEDSHAFANSLQWGPDGWLYGAHGSTVTARIRGIEFQQGVWRYHPRTKEFELFAEGGGNTWGLDFDRRGNVIAGTNHGSFANLHQVQGAYYVKGFAKHGPLHNPYTFGYFDHIPYQGFKGGHVTAGGVLYLGGAFPERMNDVYIAANPLSNVVNWHVLERQGSTFTARHGGEFLAGNDPWFRPIDCLVGPDGALYVVDWHDARLNHVDPRDNWDRRNGRIYRIRHRSAPPLGPLGLAALPSDRLIPFLFDANSWFRREARRLIAERRDPALLPALRRILAQADETALEALWAIAASGGFDEALAETTLSHPEEDVRAWTVRLLGDPKKVSSKALTRLVDLARTDPSPAVRLQLACTAKRLSAEQGLPIVRELLGRKEDVADRFIPLLCWWAIEDKAVSDRARVLGLLDTPEAWKAPLAEKHIVERLARRYMAEGGDENYAACAKLVAMSPGPAESGKLAEGMEQALAGRRLERVPAPLEKAIADLRRSLGQAQILLRLAFRLGCPEAFEAALRAAGDPKTPERQRIELAEVLGDAGKPEVVPVLLKILDDARSDALLQAAIAALQPYPDPKVLSAVLAHYPRLKGQARSRAQGFLASRPGSALELLKLVDTKKLDPKEIPLDRLAAIAQFKDEAIGALVKKHWGNVGAATPGEKLAQIASMKNMIGKAGRGDPVKGKPIFTKICAVCHTLFGEGNKVGPELTGQDRKNLDLLLNHIVDPSAMVRPEHQAWKVRTTDGQVLTGLIVEQTPGATTLLDAQNNRITIAQAKIEAVAASETSLMPEKLLDPLTDDEIRHVLAYLQADAPVQAPRAENRPGPLRVCLVSGSLEYESDASLAAFQEHLETNYAVQCSRAFRRTDEEIPGLENLETCDVALLFTRRLKPAGEALERIQAYCRSGKPLVGVRTASHAFQTWLGLDREVLGGSYTGHFGKGPPCEVRFTDKGRGHAILEGVAEYASTASLYKNQANAADTETLLMGTAAGKTEPLAWTRLHQGGRVFYTSLGDQADFRNENFRRMLANALFWTARRAPERRQGKALPGTKPLEAQGDLAEQMVAGIDRFLLREIEQSVARRAALWNRDTASREAYEKSVAANRERFRRYIGAADERVKPSQMEYVATSDQPALVGRGEGFEAYAVRWPVLRGVHGEGLLLVPTGKKSIADTVAVPDADQTPEMIAGLWPGVPPASQWARRLATLGHRVIIPTLIDRSDTWSVSAVGRGTNQPHREFAYRPAFELGRHVIGYEVQKILAAVDWFVREQANLIPRIGVFGYGEGGLLALYAAAIDTRISSTVVSGYFGPRQAAWREPIYRNVWSLLREFGDAEIVSLVAPRTLNIEMVAGPEVAGPPAARPGRAGAAPGAIPRFGPQEIMDEFVRAGDLTAALRRRTALLAVAEEGFGNDTSIRKFHDPPLEDAFPAYRSAPAHLRTGFDPQPRLKRQLDEILEDTQVLLRRSERVRDDFFWKRIDKKSIEGFEKSTEPLRETFSAEVMGRFENPLLPANPRSRLAYEEPKYVAYEVMLDVWADVFAYGLLLVPRDIRDGERRPVVVCQHGLEGRPRDLADPKIDNKAYNRYGCRLAERGFVVFAPQNPYIGRDAFRTLQRKANLLGRHLFSIIIPQHQVITDWLASLPFVDPERIAFYGLSYGGKTAMRVPAAVQRYCLSICSADFNEWIWKNAALDSPFSYVTTGEYEIFEWNLGNTFNYAEMAALIAPRPFMVERGHFDGVAPDEKVAYEYAKVRRLYAELKIADRTEIEFFLGPHTIHGVGTFEFLHKHLKWPKPQ
jgi:putative membrane-bound dehydrogenase-like protein